MSKQTAVEWLVEQFEQSHSYINEIFKETIDQAKAMEREQIEEAINACRHNYKDSDNYYNETYKGGEQ